MYPTIKGSKNCKDDNTGITIVLRLRGIENRYVIAFATDDASCDNAENTREYEEDDREWDEEKEKQTKEDNEKEEECRKDKEPPQEEAGEGFRIKHPFESCSHNFTDESCKLVTDSAQSRNNFGDHKTTIFGGDLDLGCRGDNPKKENHGERK